MKKLFLSVCLSFAAFAVTAQQFTVLDLLNVRAVQTTNTLPVLNLAATAAANTVGIVYTNNFGDRTIAAASNYENPLKDWVPIPADFARWYGQATINGTNTVQSPYCGAIHTRVVGGSGANTATTIVLQLSADGNTADTGTTISITTTPNTTTAVDVINKLTVAQLLGYKAMRVYSITAGDTDASSNVMFTKLQFVCWVP